MLGFEDDVVIDFCFNMLEKTQVICQGLVQGGGGGMGGALVFIPQAEVYTSTQLFLVISLSMTYKLYQQY